MTERTKFIPRFERDNTCARFDFTGPNSNLFMILEVFQVPKMKARRPLDNKNKFNNESCKTQCLKQALV